MEVRFLPRWVVVVTIGEGLGLAVAAAVGALFFDEPGVVLLPALVAAGLAEGALLGAAQWLVLRSELPLALGRWAGLTAVGAGAAYALGMLPSTLYEMWVDWPVVAQVVFFVGTGSALLATIGTAQWVELRHHIARAGRWILGTGAAWVAALTVFGLISTPLWQRASRWGCAASSACSPVWSWRWSWRSSPAWSCEHF